jgi:predicted nucleic acid-binding protein
MAWVVDTSLLIDVAENDPSFGIASAKLLDEKASEGLTICPVSYVELSPVFEGDSSAQDLFLNEIHINFHETWLHEDTIAAHSAWNNYVNSRRARLVKKRPVADLLIGAFATRFQGLLTRNETDFGKLFAHLKIVTPPASGS